MKNLVTIDRVRSGVLIKFKSEEDLNKLYSWTSFSDKLKIKIKELMGKNLNYEYRKGTLIKIKELNFYLPKTFFV